MTAGKARRMGGPPPTASTVDDTTEPEAPPRRADRTGTTPAEETSATPPAAPDGTFTSAANPAAAELVPASPAAAATTSSAPVDEQPDGFPTHGAVYTVPAPDRPRAEELLRPQPKIQREQISCMVPAELELVKRMRLYWAHEGVEQRDQVAFALDQWLRGRGF